MVGTVFFGGASLVPANAEIRFTSPADRETVVSEGVINLAWEVSGDRQPALFELQESSAAAFSEAETRLRYRGPDRGSVVSGMREGSHYFRVRAVEADGTVGGWSEPVHVEARYISREKVVWLLSLGGVVFVATLTTLIAGHLRSDPGKEIG